MYLKNRLQNANTDGEGGGSGGGGTDFQSLIPTEFKGHPSLEPIKDINGLVKSYISAQEMVGKNKVVVPGENAKPEEWNEFFGKLGRPDAPDKYGLKKPDKLPEGFDIQEDFLKNLGGMFHEAGLTARQANTLFSKYIDTAVNEYTTAAKEANLRANEKIAELKREWGAAYDANIDKAKRAVRAFLDDNGIKWLEQNGLNNDPQMMRVFANIGEKLGEPPADKGDGGGNSMFGPITPAAAKAEIAQKMSDSEFMNIYMDRYHPRHSWAIEQMTRLHRFAHPDNKVA